MVKIYAVSGSQIIEAAESADQGNRHNEKDCYTIFKGDPVYSLFGKPTDLELKAIAEIFQVSYIFLIDGKDE